MGLLLSILVFSVGVLEALACVRHIQQGILPAWAPRHVTTPSGRRLLRERWRKSTSRDEGGELPAEAVGDSPPTLARPRPPPLQVQERAGSPARLRSRTPDICWPEPVPHSPVKIVEQTLPSPVEEVPGDIWPSGDVLAGRRRTSVTETLPQVDHVQIEPLEASAPEGEFARETQEPRRCKPAKASSFEEARLEPAFQAPTPSFPEVTPAPRQPDVINLSFEDYSAAGPRAAVVGRIQITATKETNGDELPEPWPIVNIDTLATSDEEGDLTPPANSGSRRVSFDPTPTVVSFDKEKPIVSVEQQKPQPPTVMVTHDLEDLLREKMPAFIDQTIQEAIVKATDVLTLRGRGGAVNGVTLFLQDIVAKGDFGMNVHVDNENVEEYKDKYEGTQDQEGKISEPGIGSNIYRLMEKLKSGQDFDELLQTGSDSSKESREVLSGNEVTSLNGEYEREGKSNSQLSEIEETFLANEAEQHEHFQATLSDSSKPQNQSSEDLSLIKEKQIETEFASPLINNENEYEEAHPAHSSDVQNIKIVDSLISENEELPCKIVQPEDEEYLDLEKENSEPIDETYASSSIKEESSEKNEESLDIEEDISPGDLGQHVSCITPEVVDDENAPSPPTLFSASPVATASTEPVASSAPLTPNNGPEEAKEARILAKQVSPGPRGPLDEAQNTSVSTSAASVDSEETRISGDEPHAFDIEPGSPASPDVRSAPEPPTEQCDPQPDEGLSLASRVETVPSKGREQNLPSAAPPPPSPPPSPPPQLTPAPTTDKQQQQATDSTPRADRNESSRSKDKKKKHPLRKRSSKEKRGKRVQTPQASRSPSEDEEDAQESASVSTSTPAAVPLLPPTPVAREPPSVPAPQPEPEASGRKSTSVTSSSTSSSSGGSAAARPTTPASAPQPEAFWVRHAPPPADTFVSTATPFGPSVKKPHRRKEPSEADMPAFVPKSTRFEWPPKSREDRPVRIPRSAAFAVGGSTDPKEHFPPAPLPVPERPPTPPSPEPAPESALTSTATATSPVPDASSPIPDSAPASAEAAPEAPASNGTEANDTAANGAAAPEEVDAAREAAASPAPGRFKFEVEMPTTRPTIQPIERDPKEVVRKLTTLKQANPGVASEMLMSILGFHCPH